MKTPKSLGILTVCVLVGSLLINLVALEAEEDDGKLRIICFGAHPDDCELRAAGVGAMWAARGHHVKFVSTTNGDIGHWREAGGPLARRRKAEVEKASEILGTTVEVLDIHDGELMPTLENRETIVRLIREWKADVVMSHRPNDYHPDHRYTAILVQDAAFMVTVPFFVPTVPRLEKNPVFLYYDDRFQKPYPFAADIAVAIDEVIEKKLDAVGVMESQFLEGGALGSEARLWSSPEERKEKRAKMREGHERRFGRVADKFRDALVAWYGEEEGTNAKYAEVFEICEYGRRPSEEELRGLFPFFGGD